MNKKGFTLVELMVVIVIIGILAAVAAPKLSDNINSARCNEVPKVFKQVMDKAVEFEAVNGEWPVAFGTAGLTGGTGTGQIDVNTSSTYWTYTMENSSGGAAFTTATGSTGEFQVVATSKTAIGKQPVGAVVAVDNGGNVFYSNANATEMLTKYMNAYLKNATGF